MINRSAQAGLCISALDAYPAEVGSFNVYGNRVLVVDDGEGTMIAAALRWLMLAEAAARSDDELDIGAIKAGLERLRGTCQRFATNRSALTEVNKSVTKVSESLGEMRDEVLNIVDDLIRNIHPPTTEIESAGDDRQCRYFASGSLKQKPVRTHPCPVRQLAVDGFGRLAFGAVVQDGAVSAPGTCPPLGADLSLRVRRPAGPDRGHQVGNVAGDDRQLRHRRGPAHPLTGFQGHRLDGGDHLASFQGPDQGIEEKLFERLAQAPGLPVPEDRPGLVLSKDGVDLSDQPDPVRRLGLEGDLGSFEAIRREVAEAGVQRASLL